MATTGSNVVVEIDRRAAVAAAVRTLETTTILIGIPQENDPRPGEPIGNASLAYIHEFGSPAVNIPARPFLIPGVANAKDQILPYLRKAAQVAFNVADKTEAMAATEVKAELTKAGITAVNAVQARIRAGIPPPLSAKTIARRRRRSKGSSYRRKATTAADTTPLIDTGALLRSITYVLRIGRRR